MSRRVPALLVAVIGTSLLAACSGGDPAPAEAEATLEQQRDDVRAATSDLQAAAAEALGGQVSGSSGRWRGCEAGGLEEYRSFGYDASARVDVDGDTARPYLDRLRDVLEREGYAGIEEQDRPGGTMLRAERDGVRVGFSELPGQGDYVLLTVTADCVDVPEDERDDWLAREEPTPEIR